MSLERINRLDKLYNICYNKYMRKENKTEFIIIRCTPAEKLNLLKKAGKNLSKFIRVLLKLEN